ncbi:MAG: YceI family protein [Bradymonadia bacterium]
MSLKTFTAGLFALTALFASQAQADTYAIDDTHAAANFAVKHLGIADTHGRFNAIKGEYNLDGANSSINIEIDVASIDSNNKKRDDHLRGPDFFNVKQFPKMTFKSTKVTPGANDMFKVEGKLTIRGVTKDITIDVKKTGEGDDPWGNHRTGFETSFSINRMDYGVKYMPDGLGHDVKITLALEGIKKK